MSVRVAEGTVLISAQVDDSTVRRSATQAGQRAGDSFSRGFVRSADDGMDPQRFRRMGDDAGDNLVRGADGRLRDSRGRFRRAGQQGGDSFSTGMTRSGESGMTQASGKMGKVLMAGAAFVAAGAAVGALFTKAFTDAMAQEQSVAKLSAQVGAFGPESKKLGKVAGSLYADGYGESFDAVTEALRATKQNMAALGVSGEEDLKKVSKNAMNVADILGEEVGPTTRAVAKMIKTGLAKDATEAFDILTRGAQTGANEAEDLLDTFSEYSTQFRKLGLDGQTAMGLISQGLQGGARDADIVADAIKEFSIRAIDGSKTTIQGYKDIGLNADEMAKKIGKGGKSAQEGMAQVLDGLRKIKDPVKREAAAVALFGTQAEDLGQALFELDPTNATKTLGEVGGAAKKAGDMLHSSLSSRLERLKRTMQQTLVNFINDKVMPVIDRFQQWMKDNPAIVKPVIGAIKTLAAVFLPLAAGAGIVAALAAGFALISWPVLAVVGAIAALTLGLKYAWQNSETFRDIVMKVWDGIKMAAGEAAKFFQKDVWPSLLDGWESLQEKGQVLLDFFTGTLWPILKAGWGILMAAVSPIIERFKGIFDDLGGKANGLSGIWKNVTDVVGQKMNEIWSVVQTALQGITDIWNSWKGWLIPTLTFIWTAVGNIFAASLGNIWAIVKGAWTAISGIISGAMQVIKGIIEVVTGILTLNWSKTWQGIKDIFGGTWKAIVSLLKGAWQAISGVLVNMWNFIKSIFTKIWDWLVGHSLIPDLVNAIVGWFRKLRDWAVGIITAMKDYVVARFRSLRDGAISAIRTFRDTVTGVFRSTRDTLYSVAKWIRDKVTGAFNTLKDNAIKAFQRAKSGIKTAWDALKGIAKSPVNFIIGTVYNKGIRRVWNAVVGAFGGHKLGEVKGFARGGVLPGQSSFRNGDDQLVPMRKGEGVYVSEAMRDPYERARLYAVNRAAMKGQSLRQFQTPTTPGFFMGGIFDGIGDVASSAWDKVKKGASWLKDTFGNAIRAGVNAVVNPLINQMPRSPAFAGMIRQGAISIKDSLLGAGKKGDSKANPHVSYKAGAGVEQWRPVVNQALAQVGQPKSLAGSTLRRMNQESGGNPNIVNKWDSNWKAGHPSVGLMQVIGPTFRSYAGRYRNTGPFSYGVSVNPLANVYSSMKYALGAYGSLSRAYDRKGGYAQGGINGVTPPWVSRDMGGLLPDGMMAYNTSGTAEVVSTLDQLKALVASGKGATYIFNEGAIQLDASKVKSIQDVVEMIESLKVTSRQFGARV